MTQTLNNLVTSETSFFKFKILLRELLFNKGHLWKAFSFLNHIHIEYMKDKINHPPYQKKKVKFYYFHFANEKIETERNDLPSDK